MPYRVTSAQVRAVRPTRVNPEPFIHAAHLLVNAHLGGAGYADALMEEIERWWTAHLMEMASPSLVTREIGGTRETVASGKVGEGLHATRFGQQVLEFDVDGILTAVAGTTASLKQASFYVD